MDINVLIAICVTQIILCVIACLLHSWYKEWRIEMDLKHRRIEEKEKRRREKRYF